MFNDKCDWCKYHMCRLGEACSHIAAILSCFVRATELCYKSGLDSCTSQQCSWLPTARDVSKEIVLEYVLSALTMTLGFSGQG